MQKREQETKRSSEHGKRRFEPTPRKIDIEILAPLLIERNRKVLDMLKEYDRRQERRKSHPRQELSWMKSLSS